jgi:fructokinase
MILCAGEALIDMLPRKTEDGEAAFAPYPGGSVFNTAIALARLETPVSFFTGLSDDLFGDRLAKVLTANGVDQSLIARAARPTTLAFVTLTGGNASYTFYDENTAGRMVSEADLPEVPDTCEAAFFGGISLAVEPCAEAYVALADRMSRAGRLIMLDPNIRPGFIADEDRYRARMERLLSLADVVKVSDEDLAWLMGDGDTGVLAEAMRARGPALVLVTQGAEGVTAHGGGDPVHHPTPKAEVVDTVGAGDTFNAGFLAGLSDGGCLSADAVRAGLSDAALRAALDLGVRAAAVTVSRAGANPPRRTNCREGAGPARLESRGRSRRAGHRAERPGPPDPRLRDAGRHRGRGGKLAAKIAKLRIFQDDAGKMNRSLIDTGGGALVVSQFTLAADTARGNRPGFSTAAPPDEGERLYLHFARVLADLGPKVETGAFGADMAVTLTNDGPVTIWLDTEA